MKRAIPLRAAAALLTALALLCGVFAMPAAAAPQTIDTAGFADETLRLVNAERAAKGLAALGALDPLSAAAQKRAEEVSVKFSHTRPSFRGCFTVLADYGLVSTRAGENIASGYRSPAEAVNGWMKSSGHRANILGDFDKLGVGVCVRNGTAYWVQLFIREGTPKKPAPIWKKWPPAVQWLLRVVFFGWIWM